MTSKITAISKIAKPEAIAAIKETLKMNIYAKKSRISPNAEKLIDGAIQRGSVQPRRTDLAMKVNTDKVGLTKRPHVGVNSSGSAPISSDVWSNFGS